MVQTIATNQKNDIFIAPNGNLAIAKGIAGVEDGCQTASQAQLGEMVLAITSGVPNFQTVWIGSPTVKIWESYLQNTILAVKGVLSVVSITVTIGSNKLIYIAKISSIYGLLELSGQIPTG